MLLCDRGARARGRSVDRLGVALEVEVSVRRDVADERLLGEKHEIGLGAALEDAINELQHALRLARRRRQLEHGDAKAALARVVHAPREEANMTARWRTFPT